MDSFHRLTSSFKIRKEIALVFGEVLFDRQKLEQDPAELPAREAVGGAAANFAYRLESSLLQDLDHLEVRLASGVGDDARGKDLKDTLIGKKLNTDFIQVKPDSPTGTVDVTKHRDGNASYVINSGVAYEQIVLNENLIALAEKSSLIYFGTLIQRNQGVSSKTLREILKLVPVGTVKFVDINLRKECHSPESIRFSVENADILKINHQEVAEVAAALGMRLADNSANQTAKDFALELAAATGKKVIVTLAENGALVAYKTNKRVELAYDAGYQISDQIMKDTVGSGDAFAAKFAQLTMRAEPVNICLREANILGAAVALTEGGMSPVNAEHIELIKKLPRTYARFKQVAIHP